MKIPIYPNVFNQGPYFEPPENTRKIKVPGIFWGYNNKALARNGLENTFNKFHFCYVMHAAPTF